MQKSKISYCCIQGLFYLQYKSTRYLLFLLLDPCPVMSELHTTQFFCPQCTRHLVHVLDGIECMTANGGIEGEEIDTFIFVQVNPPILQNEST